jgi:Rrf2 family transcriptional regulator, cysteine metabolism repressor
VPLAEIAAHDGLPLAYLEHLVARLRKAGLVDSRRGSRGGYMLARPATDITMAEVVAALEGSIAPIECISQNADGSIVCSRESERGESNPHVCPTKLLWTRVRFAIVSTLMETTLADLLAGLAAARPAVATPPTAARELPLAPAPAAAKRIAAAARAAGTRAANTGPAAKQPLSTGPAAKQSLPTPTIA